MVRAQRFSAANSSHRWKVRVAVKERMQFGDSRHSRRWHGLAYTLFEYNRSRLSSDAVRLVLIFARK